MESTDSNQNEKMTKSRRRGADSVKNRRKKIESKLVDQTVS